MASAKNLGASRSPLMKMKQLWLLLVILVVGVFIGEMHRNLRDGKIQFSMGPGKGVQQYLQAEVMANSHRSVIERGAGVQKLANFPGEQAASLLERGCNDTTGSSKAVATLPCQPEDFDNIVPGLSIEGPCSCLAGQECTLHISSNDSSLWDKKEKLMQEIVLFFEGPARSFPALEVDHFANGSAAWRARYTIWDLGVYKAVIHAGCPIYHSPIATFTVTIFGGYRQDTPCSQGRLGRWLLNGTMLPYQWTPYGCGQPLAAPSDFALEFRRRGYNRITFIGDSHNRVLFQHLKYLLGCPVRERDEEEKHVDSNDTAYINDPERSIELHYHWVDGIYDNGENGCIGRGQFSGREDSFPPVPRGSLSDLFVLNSGTWSAQKCAEPFQAYTRHIHRFLDWGRSLLGEKGGKLVWRTTSPSRWTCDRKNVVLDHFNKLTNSFVSGMPYKVFNSWEVEAPFFLETDGTGHYSTLIPSNKTSNVSGAMSGVVGEATTRAFMTWVLDALPLAEEF